MSVLSQFAVMDRASLFRGYVVFVMYLAAVQELLVLVMDSALPALAFPLKALIQGVLYFPPLILCWYGRHSWKTVLVLLIVLNIGGMYLYIEKVTFVATLQSAKAVFLPLFYIPILQYLNESDPGFWEKFEKHFENIAWLFATVAIFEVFSWFLFPNAINDWLRQIGDRKNETWYPESLFNRYSSGAIFSNVAIYSFMANRYLRTFIFSLMTFLSMAKTRMVMFIATFLLLVSARLRIRAIVWLAAGAALGVWILFAVSETANPVTLILHDLEFASDENGVKFATAGTQRLYEHLVKSSVDALQESWYPHGLLDAEMVGITNLVGQTPGEREFIANYPDTEVAFVSLAYGFGPLIMALYVLVLYRPLFDLNILRTLGNNYKVLLLFSAVSLLHYWDLNFLSLYLFVLMVSIRSFSPLPAGVSFQGRLAPAPGSV